ncbi:MAG: DUF493 family protein [Bacteroidota bacterium]
MYNQDRDKFQELLDDQYDWPAEYLFKFIAPSDKKEELIALFPKDKVQLRPSSKGNYTSITASIILKSSQEVMAIYDTAYKIEGVISL